MLKSLGWRSILRHTLVLKAWVCEKEKERDGDVVFLHSHVLTGNAETIQPYVLSACVTNEKERSDETEDTACPNLVSSHIHTGNGRQLEDIIWMQVKKQTLYRPVTCPEGPAGWGSHISWQSAHEGGKFVSPKHRPPLPSRKYSRYSFLLQAESTPAQLLHSNVAWYSTFLILFVWHCIVLSF